MKLIVAIKTGEHNMSNFVRKVERKLEQDYIQVSTFWIFHILHMWTTISNTDRFRKE